MIVQQRDSKEIERRGWRGRHVIYDTEQSFWVGRTWLHFEADDYHFVHGDAPVKVEASVYHPSQTGGPIKIDLGWTCTDGGIRLTGEELRLAQVVARHAIAFYWQHAESVPHGVEFSRSTG